jgi:poly(3-hydroxybutyrate) depolymerase
MTMRNKIVFGALAAVAGLVAGPVAPASAAPIDDCRGLRLVCVFEHPNHGGQATWTEVNDGTYNTQYRTRTTASNVVNSTNRYVILRAYDGWGQCQVWPNSEVNFPGYLDNNLGQIVIGNWSDVPGC